MILSKHQRSVLEIRLLENRRVTGTDCWIWTKSCQSFGYGQTSIPDMKTHRNVRVHRVSAALWKGFDIDSPMFVIHSCDTPRCFNPDHLRIATPAENTADMMQKGRNGNRVFRGEDNKRSKMTEVQVREMRLMQEEGSTYAELGSLYGITPQGAFLICKRRNWKHIP